MADVSTLSKSYLEDLRADERFVRLLTELEVPQIPSFHPKKGETHGAWEYYSGLKDGAISILSVLKGTTEV